jgi:hypothetical protein
MEALWLIVSIVGVILWLVTRSQVKDLKQRLAELDTSSLSAEIRAPGDTSLEA